MAHLASLVANLRRSAKRFPDRCAIQEDGRSASFAALLELARALARQLICRGVRSGDRVALILPNGIEFVAGYYGALMAGAVVVPMSSMANARELEAWLRDCAPEWILTEPANAEAGRAASAAGLAGRVGLVDSSAIGAFRFPVEPAPHSKHVCDENARRVMAADEFDGLALDPDAPASILYTSGTTGRPKGVVLTHRNLATNTNSIVHYLQLTHHDCTVAVLPFCYAYGASVLHTHVRAGGRVVIARNFVYPHLVVQALVDQRATGFSGVPSTFALLISRVRLEDYDLSHLRYVTQAGGPMSPQLTLRLQEALPGTQVIVMYGQTEATARLTFLPAARLKDKLGSVGIPISGVRIEIRDEKLRPLPANQIGEIWANGPGVMLGYWRNEAATAAVKRDGWLRTCDMGRLDEDGFLYLVGRRSDIIKVGAYRVHPQDIEDVIAECPQVQEVAVVGVEDELLGHAIMAYVVPIESSSLTPMQVLAHCRARLASYKLPKAVRVVQQLPKTATGKIRRSDLKERSS